MRYVPNGRDRRKYSGCEKCAISAENIKRESITRSGSLYRKANYDCPAPRSRSSIFRAGVIDSTGA
jgi:hypothetical protein